MNFELGYATGDYQMHYLYPQFPLYYRQFYNSETEKTYTVVLNVWNFLNDDIPAQDGVWFEGDWPSGVYQQIFF